MTPLPCRWDGEGLIPLPNWSKRADELLTIGEVYAMAPVEERSSATHAHYFAVVHEAWSSLPEAAGERFPTAGHLRKYALIKTGYRDERSIACASRAEALRVAAFIKPMDDFAVVTVSGSMVTVYTAKSQSMKAMRKAAFQESKEAVLGFLATLLDVPAETLAAAA